MKYDLDLQVVDRAKDCPKGQPCLKDPGFTLCPVSARLAADTLVVHCKGRPDCMYRDPLGDIAVCRCPVRKEIYAKYRS